MAASGSVSIKGTVTGLLTGTKTVGPITVSNSTASSETHAVIALASGDNTVSVPSTASMALVVFAAASTSSKTVRTVVGDTGITVSKTGPVFLPFDTTSLPTNLYINSSAADTGLTTEILFI